MKNLDVERANSLRFHPESASEFILKRYLFRRFWDYLFPPKSGIGWLERNLGGHISIGGGRTTPSRLTIYGFNAMHVAVNFYTERWGYICLHPTFRVFGCWWAWYFYVSPDATPYSATFKRGPGVFS